MSPKFDQQIRSIAKQSGLILLYHSVATSIPKALEKTLHNVTPEILNKHVEDLSGFFRFVSLKEFSRARSKKGLAAITFDDGYKNVLEHALPVLESFNYSFTVFLNPVTFEKHWNWRDKVRYLIHHKLENNFSRQFNFSYQSGRFYRYSKNPLNNSAELDQKLDLFLQDRQIGLYREYPYLQKHDLIFGHPLIEYGNHTQNHYVLASLNEDQQKSEIEIAQKVLNDIKEISLSNCFAVPFGGNDDINSYTNEIAKSLYYQSLLMSRQSLQPNQALFKKIQVLERFMARSDDIITELAAFSKY